ncbi:AI-2E family transporter [archaeon]|nr:AI-2E family transporter [archaeon]
MDDNYYKQFFSIIILLILAVLCFLIIKPIIMAIIMGFILSFIFMPLYKKLILWTKSQNLSAGIICVGLLAIFILPIWFLSPVAIDQAVKVYFASQDFDFVTPLKSIFPSVFTSETFAVEAGNAIGNFVTGLTDALVRSFSKLVLEIPALLLQLVVVLFTLFFVLRDKDRLFDFVKSFSPFSKEVEKKLAESSSGITASVLYGQVVIGTIQGTIAGIGFLIFGVPNAILLGLLAIVAGIFPVIGTILVWGPVFIYSILQMSSISIIGIFIFGFISTNIDNFLRPLIVSRRVKIPSVIIILGMIGGVFFFGVLGFILGPLVIAYLLIILEGYQFKKKKSKFFIEEESEQKLLFQKFSR